MALVETLEDTNFKERFQLLTDTKAVRTQLTEMRKCVLSGSVGASKGPIRGIMWERFRIRNTCVLITEPTLRHPSRHMRSTVGNM